MQVRYEWHLVHLQNDWDEGIGVNYLQDRITSILDGIVHITTNPRYIIATTIQ
jgi:hypothetical protein